MTARNIKSYSLKSVSRNACSKRVLLTIRRVQHITKEPPHLLKSQKRRIDMKKRKVNMKELMKGKNKGYFRSRGYSTIKHTYIDDKGKQVEELLEFEIQPLGGHPLLKEYVKNNPEPKPPVKRELINTETGKSVTEEGVSIKEVKNNPKFKWANVFDYTDEGFIEERDE